MDCSICYYAAKHLIVLFLTGTQRWRQTEPLHKTCLIFSNILSLQFSTPATNFQIQIQLFFCQFRTIAGESIRIIWKENKSDRWMKIWQKSESKTLKLSTSASHSHAEMTDSGLLEQQLLPCDKHPFIAHMTSVLLSFCFLCNSCLLISVVYLKKYLWRVTWIINRVKRIRQRRCSMIHFSTNTTANITAWNTVIITIAMENPMSVKRVFYQIIRVKQYNHEVSY